MAIIPAVVTNDARKYWPQFFGTLLGIGITTVSNAWNPLIKKFKVGEGGWIDPGTGKVPRSPDPDLRYESGPLAGYQDLDALIDSYRGAPRYPAPPDHGRGAYSKNLGVGDFTFESPSVIRVRCFLDYEEFNENFVGSGTSPQIYEIGLFSDHPINLGGDLMVAYGTIPVEIKDATKQLENVVRIVF